MIRFALAFGFCLLALSACGDDEGKPCLTKNAVRGEDGFCGCPDGTHIEVSTCVPDEGVDVAPSTPSDGGKVDSSARSDAGGMDASLERDAGPGRDSSHEDAQTQGHEDAADVVQQGAADTGSPVAMPPACAPAAEDCDGKDQDCDGVVDNGVTTRCWADMDGDGFAASGAKATDSCDACGAKQTATEPTDAAHSDCNDSDATRSPGATDICGDMVDNDCDGTPDDDANNACSGPCSMQLPGKPGDTCSNGQEGACARAGKYECRIDHSLVCTAEKVAPAGAEVCGDGKDNDCKGGVDDGCVMNECKGWSKLAGKVGDPCAAAAMGECAQGHIACSGTEAIACTPGSPSASEVCGDGKDNDCKGGVDDGCTVPDPVRGNIGAGEGFACALRASGQPVCWGSGLGRAGGAPTVSFAALSVGTSHACGVRPDGHVQCWGGNLSGQASPPQTAGFVGVASGHNHSCGLRSDGAVVCWGANESGQSSPPSRMFSTIAAGHASTCGVGVDGLVSCWGWGDGRTDAPSTVAFDTITLGGIGGCGIRSTDQHIQCWQGGTPTASLKPPTGAFSRVAYGASYLCGTRPNGRVECWGDNPVPSPADTYKEVALSPTQFFACGITTAGSVSCWGDDASTLPSPPGPL